MLPGLVFLGFNENFTKLKNKNAKQLFGAFYSNLDTNCISKVNFTALFLARRLIYALNLVLLTESELFQILLQILMSLGLLCYLITVMPYEKMIDNYLEIFNESCIIILFYSSIGFSRAISITGETRELIGFFCIGFLCLIIAFNFLAFIISLCLAIKLRINKRIAMQ